MDDRGRSRNSSDRKKNFGRGRKRPKKFFGSNKEDGPPAPKRSRSSSSHRKIQECSFEASNTRNRLIDINILFPELVKVMCCSKCHGKVELSESSIRGLGFKIIVTCEQCNQVASINSTKSVGSQGNACEVNRRSVLASRALGQGYAGLSTFCGIMDLPQPIAHSAFDRTTEQLSEVCEKVAKSSMTVAVSEEKAETSNQDQLCVSGDGSWRKSRGFCSLQGISSIVGHKTGKVLDVSIKSSFCKACANWEGKQDIAAYEEWYEGHKNICSCNHEGSAGKMEVDGICEMFARSEENYRVKYVKYVGDGDSKVFKKLLDVKPYGEEVSIEKKECVGHVQKRMGTRLRNLKKTLAGTKLSDEKGIGGAGRLTAQRIDLLTTYYGNAIRAHSDSVMNMSNAIWATFYHKRSTDENPQHHLCPPGLQSWCKWQKAQATGNLETFKHTGSFPPAVMDAIQPIYKDLTDPELLRRCVGGFTQNNNESFNNAVWKLVPKTYFSGFNTLKVGAYIAVSCFNDGRSGFLKVMEEFQIQPGEAAVKWMKTSDDQRLFHAERKVQASTLEARRMRRRVRLQIPEDSYEAGGY